MTYRATNQSIPRLFIRQLKGFSSVLATLSVTRDRKTQLKNPSHYSFLPGARILCIRYRICVPPFENSSISVRACTLKHRNISQSVPGCTHGFTFVRGKASFASRSPPRRARNNRKTGPSCQETPAPLLSSQKYPRHSCAAM